MTCTQKNRIRALVLLLVFSLNILAGFACAVGVDMGYNGRHHPHKSHVKHGHHGHEKPHVHAKAAHKGHHHENAGVQLPGESGNCCSEDVTQFAQMDKLTASGSPVLQLPVFFLSEVTLLFLPVEPPVRPGVNSRFPFVRRSCFLNDIDLRIAIRSFLI
jgi:hypothetical protein